MTESLSERAVLGSTGYQPVPSGNLPDGMGAASMNNPGAGFKCDARSHSGRQVADRGGQVARATLFKRGAEPDNVEPIAAPRKLLRLLRLGMLLFAWATASLQAEDSPKSATPKFLGVQSCSSSSCHGSAKTNFDQVLVWERRDYHTRSHATLATARSKRLAEVLKINDAAQSTRCTTCHAPFHEVPPEQRTAAVDVIHGVSCENCHGPADAWIRAHTRLDLTHEEKVAAGMRDLRNLYVRANTCIACHQNVEAELLKAGHPELVFELDGQCVTEPRHWHERRDDCGPALWLTGQAAALREMSWSLAQQKEPLEKEVERWSALRWLLEKVGLKTDSAPGSSEKAPGFSATQQAAEQMTRVASESRWPTERIRSALRNLAGAHLEFTDSKVPPSLQARRAERLVLALDRLSIALPELDATKKANSDLDELFRAIQSLPDFDPPKFAKLLRQFEGKLSDGAAAAKGR